MSDRKEEEEKRKGKRKTFLLVCLRECVFLLLLEIFHIQNRKTDVAIYLNDCICVSSLPKMKTQ